MFVNHTSTIATPRASATAQSQPGAPIEAATAKDQHPVSILGQRLGFADCPSGAYQERLGQLNASHSSYLQEVSGSRTKNFPTTKATIINAPDGLPLPGNYIVVDDSKGLGMAFEYPSEKNIDPYLRTILERKTTVIVVLASDEDIRRSHWGDNSLRMPEYFRSHCQYGHLEIEPSFLAEKTLSDELNIDQYRLDITDHLTSEAHSLNVLHVVNWPEDTSLSAESLQDLAHTVHQYSLPHALNKHERPCDLPTYYLPTIQGNAGIGRSAQLLVALGLTDTSSSNSLEGLVTQIREQRGPQMLPSQSHLIGLYNLAVNVGKPIFVNN